jgi:hypothetical protein
MSARRRRPEEDSAIEARVGALAWPELQASLDAQGYATTGPLLSPQECANLAALWTEQARFRSRVVMARHGFGQGEYQYFAYPHPPLIAALRRTIYPHLATVANRWADSLGIDTTYPAQLEAYLRRCHAAGQPRPTPLLLKYEAGDYNCLHQDLYGALAFPLQLTVLLSAPSSDFTGGEFMLVEQRPRAQSKGEVVPLAQGEAVIFAVNHRPAQGKRGTYRVALRHGVSRLRSGRRFALGIIFHDAA